MIFALLATWDLLGTGSLLVMGLALSLGDSPLAIILSVLTFPAHAFCAVSLWRMNRWALFIFPILTIVFEIVRSIERPDWVQSYPILGYATPLVPVALFLLCVAPYWGRMSWRFRWRATVIAQIFE